MQFWKQQSIISLRIFSWEPKGVDVCSEIVFSGHARAEHDGDEAHVNSWWLWLCVKSLHSIRSAEIPAWVGEVLIKFHSWMRNCWQLMAFEERVLFSSGMWCLRDYLCSNRRPCTHAHTNGTKWTVWYPCPIDGLMPTHIQATLSGLCGTHAPVDALYPCIYR